MKKNTIVATLSTILFVACSNEKEHIVATHPNGEPAIRVMSRMKAKLRPV